MAADERLIVREGTSPATADGASLGCIMLVSGGHDDEIQWFEFKTNYMSTAIYRVEWEVETMFVVIPTETANWLIKSGYARPMTVPEARAYNNSLEKEERPKETA
jgi:hypothetical protein